MYLTPHECSLLSHSLQKLQRSFWDFCCCVVDIVRSRRSVAATQVQLDRWEHIRPQCTLHSFSSGVSVEIHSLSWPNADPRLVEWQQKVFDFLRLPINRHHLQIDHGLWMNAVLQSATADVVLFVDNDCIPLNAEVVESAVNFVHCHQTFVGVAQCSNHIAKAPRVFAAPAFLAIPPLVWKSLSSPDLRASRRADVAEELSQAASRAGLRYRALYPRYYARPGQWGVYALDNYGDYGIGTVFDESVFHLYEGRMSQNIDLFVEVCQAVIARQSLSSLVTRCSCDWA